MANVNNEAWVKTAKGWVAPGKPLPEDEVKELSANGIGEEVVTEDEKAEHKRLMSAVTDVTKEYDDAFAKQESRKAQVAELETKRERAQTEETKTKHQESIDAFNTEIEAAEVSLNTQRTLLDRLAGTNTQS